MNSFSSVGSYSTNISTLTPGITNITSISGSSTVEQNNSTYSINSYDVFFFKNLTVPSNSVSTDATGSFKLTVLGTTTVYYLVWGGGGSGGSGDSGGGGGASGDLIQGSVTLNTGVYNCTYTIGAGGRSIGWQGSASYNLPGERGYGYSGTKSSIKFGNLSAIDASGGGLGGPSDFSNGATGGFVLGGGSGTSGTGGLNGSSGSKFSGGGNTTGGARGGGGGASPVENGVTATTSAGNRGGKGVASSTLTTPFNNFSNGVTYFCEGGGGASRNTTVSISSFYSIGGRGGWSGNLPTSGASNTGSGGGGLFQNPAGLSSYSGTGANGGILLAIQF